MLKKKTLLFLPLGHVVAFVLTKLTDFIKNTNLVYQNFELRKLSLYNNSTDLLFVFNIQHPNGCLSYTSSLYSLQFL